MRRLLNYNRRKLKKSKPQQIEAKKLLNQKDKN